LLALLLQSFLKNILFNFFLSSIYLFKYRYILYLVNLFVYIIYTITRSLLRLQDKNINLKKQVFK